MLHEARGGVCSVGLWIFLPVWESGLRQEGTDLSIEMAC